MNNQGQYGNIMSRLQGLKTVSKRRVMPGAEFLNEEENLNLDPEGTSQPLPDFQAFVPPKENMPEADYGGEITPQSYDVRANVARPPQPEPEEGFFSKLGNSLGQLFKQESSGESNRQLIDRAREASRYGNKTVAQTPPVETAQVDLQAGLPPITSSQQQAVPNQESTWYQAVGNALKEYVEPFGKRGHYYGEMTPEREEMLKDSRLRAAGIVPEEQRAEEARIHKNTQDVVMGRIDKALENPTTTAVYGTSDIVANQPDLQKKFQEISGIDYTPELAEQTKATEKVLQDIQDGINLEGNGYTEQEKRLQQRILNNEYTDNDKYYVGLAVLLPLLVGSFFGKEAALGALGGTAKGFSDILGKRQKENMENEKLLADINLNKGNLALKQSELDLKRLALPSELRKNLPEDPNAHLIGKQKVTWIDPSDGMEKEGVQIKPGLIAHPEYVKDKEELKEMRKEANEIYEAINPTKEINKLTGDIIDIAGKLKDKNIVGQALGDYLSGKNPGLATKLGENIEYQGRMVNSYVVLEHKLKLLVDAYRQAKGMRALTNTVQEHIDSLFRNPAASFQSYQDTVDQMLYTRDLAQSRLLNSVTGAGFVPEFVIEQLQPEVRSTYDKLNTLEGEKESAELLRE